MVCVSIAGWKAGKHEIELMPSMADLDLDEPAFSNISVNATLDLSARKVHVVLDVSADAHLVCDRSLDAYQAFVEGSFDVVFVAGDADEENGLRGYERSNPVLDLTQDIRDTLLLALPIKRIAPHAQEWDEVQSFGLEEGAVDPRWEALKQLKDS